MGHTAHGRGREAFHEAFKHEYASAKAPAAMFQRTTLTRHDWPEFIDGYIDEMNDWRERRGGLCSDARPDDFDLPAFPTCRCGHYDDEHDLEDSNACTVCMCANYRAGKRLSRKLPLRVKPHAEVVAEQLAASPRYLKQLDANAVLLAGGIDF